MKETLALGSYTKLFHDEGKLGRFSRRRHDLVAAVVESSFSFSSDGIADDAIRCFRTIKSLAERNGLLTTFSWAGAAVAIQTKFQQHTCPPCSPELFDQFCLDLEATQGWKIYPSEISNLRLFHPTSPDPWPALYSLKKVLYERDLRNMKQSTVNHYGDKFLRTMVLLELRGAVEEAQRTELIIRKHFKAAWKNRAATIREMK